jgi:glycosyltransferase involved in cell wall biosynthesis
MCKHLALSGVSIDFVLPYSAEHGIDFMNITAASPIKANTFMGLGGAYDTFCSYCMSVSCEHAYPKDLRAQQQLFANFVEQHAATSDADVIHMHDWLTFEAGMKAKQVTGKPLIAHVHATEFDRSGEFGGNPLVHEIEYNGLLMADRIIAVSQITKDIIAREYGIPSDKIEVVHNSIDTTELDRTTPESTYVYLREMKARGYKVVVSLGRLTVQKGLTYMLKAAQQAIHQNPKLLFLIAGSGEQRDELLELSANLGIAHNIIFTGFIRGSRWRDAYAIGDMFVMPSVSEPFGLTALEAAGLGNAILLSKQSGVGEMLKNTLRFDYWDTDKFANYMVSIANYPELQHELQHNAMREFEHFSWHAAAEKCHDLYRQHTLQQGVLV